MSAAESIRLVFGMTNDDTRLKHVPGQAESSIARTAAAVAAIAGLALLAPACGGSRASSGDPRPHQDVTTSSMPAPAMSRICARSTLWSALE